MGLLDLLAIVLRRWRFVIVISLSTAIVSLIAVLLMPPVYVTGTVLVPFAGGGQSRTQLALSQLPAGVAGMFGAGGAGAERLVETVLGSRTLRDSVVKRAARGPNGEAAVGKVLRKGIRVQRNPDGSVLLQVRAGEPQLAARIANTFPPLLNNVLARLSAEGALGKRRFLQAQVDTAQQRLSKSEQQMLSFQSRRAAPALDDQARRTVDAAASIQEGIYRKEVEVALLKRTATPDNPQLRAAEAELAAVRGQLRRLTSGGAGSAVFVPMSEGPGLRAASVRLLREFGQDEKIYEALTAALAESQIDANNDLPILSVLDSAMVPLLPARSIPNTLLMSLTLGFVLGLAGALGSEAMEHLRRSPAGAPLLVAWDGFRRDLGRLIRRGNDGAPHPPVA